jgi:hypothetical protein
MIKIVGKTVRPRGRRGQGGLLGAFLMCLLEKGRGELKFFSGLWMYCLDESFVWWDIEFFGFVNCWAGEGINNVRKNINK